MCIITKTVLILSLVSLFTDIASYILYPVLPVYLSGIGFSVSRTGVLEGFVGFAVCTPAFCAGGLYPERLIPPMVGLFIAKV